MASQIKMKFRIIEVFTDRNVISAVMPLTELDMHLIFILLNDLLAV